MVEKHKTLVLGASLNPERYSQKAINMLKNANISVIAYGLKAGEINGVQIDTKLKMHDDIHTVTLYINPKRQLNYISYILSLKPKRVIFNPGTENPEFYKVLELHSIYYEEACTLILLSTNQY